MKRKFPYWHWDGQSLAKFQKPKPQIKIDTITLASLIHSAADALLAAERAGLVNVQFDGDVTLRNFLRFCLGRDDLETKEVIK